MVRAGFGLVLASVAAAPVRGQDDWRLGMLKREGFTGETKELETLAAGYAAAEEGLDEALKGLGSDDFKTRERAQAAILMAGDVALSWIGGLPVQEDPEVRIRLKEIAGQLQFIGPGSREELLRYAVRTLLAERKEGAKPGAARLVVAEFFDREEERLKKRYGSFEFHADAGMHGSVTDGRLRFAGNRPGDGDQYLVLTAGALGMEKLPARFRVSCLMGGDAEKGAGAWHIGVSVGQVRVLYHPGLGTGSYRLETTGGKTDLCPNKPMGFEPRTDALQRMEIAVRTLRDGDVELSVGVASADGRNVFRDRMVVDGKVIGKVDRVGLWRSGRTGADAVFDDFLLDLRGK